MPEILRLLPGVAAAIFICSGGAIGFLSLLGFRLNERTITTFMAVLTGTSTVCSLVWFFHFLFHPDLILNGTYLIAYEVGHHQFALDYHVDVLSSGYLVLIFGLGGIVGHFSRRYLHNEEGFSRFYTIYSFFLAGMTIAATAGSLDYLFVGWEMVGLSSVLLVAFYWNRIEPSRNSVAVWMNYRLADIAFIAAIASAHHFYGDSRFTSIASNPPPAYLPWLILFASMAKGGQIPFTGWLPRAMEGPTPSSAIFYGSLAVHLGPFLLIRNFHLFETAPEIKVAMGALGLLTALYAAMVGRTRSDIKSRLAYATIAQVGMIYLEISLGWIVFAAIHAFSHAILRTLQFLRSPSVIHDTHHFRITPTEESIETRYPRAIQWLLYRVSIQSEVFVGGFIYQIKEFLQMLGDRVHRFETNINELTVLKKPSTSERQVVKSMSSLEGGAK